MKHILFGFLSVVGAFALGLFLCSCQSTDLAPDPALFPQESQQWNAGYKTGFKKGFHEGLVYNALSTQSTP